MESRLLRLWVAAALGVAVAGCDQSRGQTETAPWLEFPWPEADLLFQRDPHWMGGDGAYSIDLGGGRVLWLFGDSWIDPSGHGTRDGAVMVSNSLAIQRGYDPSRATAEFFWEPGPSHRDQERSGNRAGRSRGTQPVTSSTGGNGRRGLYDAPA